MLRTAEFAKYERRRRVISSLLPVGSRRAGVGAGRPVAAVGQCGDGLRGVRRRASGRAQRPDHAGPLLGREVVVGRQVHTVDQPAQARATSGPISSGAPTTTNLASTSSSTKAGSSSQRPSRVSCRASVCSSPNRRCRAPPGTPGSRSRTRCGSAGGLGVGCEGLVGMAGRDQHRCADGQVVLAPPRRPRALAHGRHRHIFDVAWPAERMAHDPVGDPPASAVILGPTAAR